MKKISVILLLIFCFLYTPTNIYAEIYAEPIINSPCAILIDSKSGEILFEKNSDEKKYPASTTKIMTGILAIENAKLNDTVVIGKNPPLVEIGSSQIYLVEGEQLTLEQLLYALMLESANDAAIAIAEHISGSTSEFANLMNNKVKELNALNTNFINPNGLHNDNHYTTAKDLAMIARYAMQNPTFREIVHTFRYTIPQTNKQEAREYITNGNKLIWKTSRNKNYYEYAIGVKTGYTTVSKHCLVACAKQGDTELITVVLGAEKEDIYKDTIAMFEYGFNNFQRIDLLKKEQIVTTVPIKINSKLEEKINLLASEDFSLLLKNNEKDKIKSTISVVPNITAPIEQNQVLGNINYTLDGKSIKKINLISSVNIKPPVKKRGIFWWLLYVVLIFLLLRTLIVLIRLKRKRHKKNIIYTKR